jgi:hypothetical protein
MRTLVRRLLPLAVVVSLAGPLLPSTASAQEPSSSDIAQARQLGQQAQAAYDAGNYAESERLWGAASRLYPAAPTLTLGLARAQSKAGHLVAAQESYNKIIREWEGKSTASPAFKDALEAAKTEVGGVSARIAYVVINVEGAPNPQVTIDGAPVNNAALGLKRPVDPGQHVVKATAEGYKPAEQQFSVGEAGNAEAKLKLEKGDSGAAVVAPPPKTGPTEPPKEQPQVEVGKGGSSNKTLALVAFGVGGVGIVVGAVTGLIAVGKHSDLADKCPDNKCPADVQGDVDSYKSMGTISTISFIVGAVGVGAGAVLWFTAPKESAQSGSRFATIKTKDVSMTPYVGLGSAGVTGRF